MSGKKCQTSYSFFTAHLSAVFPRLFLRHFVFDDHLYLARLGHKSIKLQDSNQ